MSKLETLARLNDSPPDEVKRIEGLIELEERMAALPSAIAAQLAPLLESIQASARTRAELPKLLTALNANLRAVHEGLGAQSVAVAAVKTRLRETTTATEVLSRQVNWLKEQKISWKVLLWTAGAAAAVGIALGSFGTTSWQRRSESANSSSRSPSELENWARILWSRATPDERAALQQIAQRPEPKKQR